jgi:putative transposase
MVASKLGVATSLFQSAGRYPPPHGILKENLLWVRTFDTMEELRATLVEFAGRYNETWLVARHGYRTPAQVRADNAGLDQNTTADLKLAA